MMNSLVKALDSLLPTDEFFNNLEKWGFGSFNYFEDENKGPPYNIVFSEDKSSATVEVACAGYKKEDIGVEFDTGTLRIYGKVSSESTDEKKKNYLYKGITSKSFSYSFPVASIFALKEARYENGMLYVDFVRNAQSPNKVEIK